MARYLKQSTAFTFRIGPFVDSTDGVTAETGLTIGQADIQISKAGGAFAQTSASPTTTHDTDGWYQCPLTATDTNTLGPLTVQIVVAGALPVWEHFMVLPANVYDSLVAGSDNLDVNAAQVGGTTPESAAEIADAVWDEATSGHTTAGTFGEQAKTVVDRIEADTQDLQAQVGTDGAGLTALPWNAAWDAEVQSEVTDALNAYDPPTNAELEARTLAAANYATASALATVDSNVDAILEDTGTTIPGTITTVDSVVDAIKVVTDKLDTALEDDGSSGFQFTILALENGPSGEGASASAIADAVWDEALSGHLTAGTTGAALNTAASASGLDAAGVRAAIGLASANLDTQLGTIDSNVDAVLEDTGTTIPASLTTIDNEVAAIQATADAIEADTQDIQSRLPAALVSGRMDASVGAMAANTLTASALATDAVTEIQSGLATAAALTTVDNEIAALQTSVNDVPTNAELATALDTAGDEIVTALATAALSGTEGVDEQVTVNLPGGGTVVRDVTRAARTNPITATQAP